MIRVILVDDHTVLRQGLRRIVDAEPDMQVVGETGDGSEVLDLVDRTQPDVAVLDLSLPGLGGAELVPLLRELRPELRIVILTMFPEDSAALHLVQSGAAAYLGKQRDPAEVLAAIRRTAAGARYLTDTLTELALSPMAAESRPPHERLTARERQVFDLLVAGRTVSRVADLLELSASTVSSHVAAIKTKLGVGSVAEIVNYAWRAGLTG